MNIHISERQTMKQQLSLYLAKDEGIDPMYKQALDHLTQLDELFRKMFLIDFTVEEAHILVHLSDEKPRPLNDSQHEVFRALCDRWYKNHSDVNLLLAGVLLRRIVENCSPYQGNINN